KDESRPLLPMGWSLSLKVCIMAWLLYIPGAFLFPRAPLRIWRTSSVQSRTIVPALVCAEMSAGSPARLTNTAPQGETPSSGAVGSAPGPPESDPSAHGRVPAVGGTSGRFPGPKLPALRLQGAECTGPMRNKVTIENIEQLRRRQGIEDAELWEEIRGLHV